MKVRGVVRPPGDKSISHRVLMLAALAHGTSKVEGLLPGDDVKSSARVLRQLGAEISAIRAQKVTVTASRISRPASRLTLRSAVDSPAVGADHFWRPAAHIGPQEELP